MYELRILSGLHRGATLPLDERPHVLGASEDADVVLVDPGIAEKHATLTLTGTGWLLSALDGGLRRADSNRQHPGIELAVGDFARVGEVWVTVVEQDAQWENPPPEPDDDYPDINAEQDEQAGEPEAAGAEVAETAPPQETPPADVLPAQEPAASPTDDASEAARHAMLKWLAQRKVYMPLGAAIISVAAAYSLMSAPETALSAKKIEALRSAASTSPAAGGDRTVAGAYEALNGGPPAMRPLTPAELRVAFRKRLSDADLLRRFDLSLQDNFWSMKAALDDEETARFERILTAFMKQHGITFPVHAKVGSAEQMLPFKIRQVISGSNASVVTAEGVRLFVGDEYQGVRLVSIRGNRLVFAGKRRIEVQW